MGLAAPEFYDEVTGVINTILRLFALVIGVWAFVHCLTQKAEGFPALGTLAKGAWLAILGASAVLGFLLQSPLGIFSLISIAASAIYLLDVRPGLRDLTDGGGKSGW